MTKGPWQTFHHSPSTASRSSGEQALNQTIVAAPENQIDLQGNLAFLTHLVPIMFFLISPFLKGYILKLSCYFISTCGILGRSCSTSTFCQNV